MALKPKYSDLLSDILEKKQNQCICPTEFLTILTKPKNIEGGCQFGPDCEFTSCDHNQVACNYNAAECTCFAQCTCGPDTPSVRMVPDIVCPYPKCICEGTCFCKSEESILNKSMYRPPAHCDKALCVCSLCLCRSSEGSNANLLPSVFRNNIKQEAQNIFMTDEMMKKECEEIKQLLNEHKQCNKMNPSTDNELKKDQAPTASNYDDEQALKPPTPNKESETRRSAFYEDKTIVSIRKSCDRGILRPVTECQTKSQRTKKDVKLHEKQTKKKSVKQSSTVKSTTIKLTKFSRQSTFYKKRPPRIRYYYSGGVEHYGVKLGHKHCLDRPSPVPKHMGWLWNIEDTSKGIRERKGWPPGFIGKNIKNMIKVMKHVKGSDVGPGGEMLPADVSRWKTLPPRELFVDNDEPKEEPPLLHIHKKGRIYNITFCPKNSDEDIGPIPIPFTITEKKCQSDTESSDSTLEFELHSPKPRGKFNRPKTPQVKKEVEALQSVEKFVPPNSEPNPSVAKASTKKKQPKKKSIGSTENKVIWEEQQTQIQNIS